MADSVTLAAVPEPEASWRPLSLEERIAWTPALRKKYMEISKYGLYTYSDREWDLMAISGEIVLVEAPEPVACIIYAMYPYVAELHGIRWGSLGQGNMGDVGLESSRWLFSEYPNLLRVEMRLPVNMENEGKLGHFTRWLLGHDWNLVGTIPHAFKLKGEVMDALYFVITREH